MDYTNSETKTRINLDYLSESERKFYREALKKFRENVNWLIFDEFAFGMKSPIYLNRSSHLDVFKEPLFLALKDMFIQLGIQQGVITNRMENAWLEKNID